MKNARHIYGCLFLILHTEILTKALAIGGATANTASDTEIMSSIAGLGMFVKSSEERTLNKLESMLNSLEARIMKRLDNLDERLGAIEHTITKSNDAVQNKSNDEVQINEPNDEVTAPQRIVH